MYPLTSKSDYINLSFVMATMSDCYGIRLHEFSPILDKFSSIWLKYKHQKLCSVTKSKTMTWHDVKFDQSSYTSRSDVTEMGQEILDYAYKTTILTWWEKKINSDRLFSGVSWDITDTTLQIVSKSGRICEVWSEH